LPNAIPTPRVTRYNLLLSPSLNSSPTISSLIFHNFSAFNGSVAHFEGLLIWQSSR